MAQVEHIDGPPRPDRIAEGAALALYRTQPRADWYAGQVARVVEQRDLAAWEAATLRDELAAAQAELATLRRQVEDLAAENGRLTARLDVRT